MSQSQLAAKIEEISQAPKVVDGDRYEGRIRGGNNGGRANQNAILRQADAKGIAPLLDQLEEKIKLFYLHDDDKKRVLRPEIMIKQSEATERLLSLNTKYENLRKEIGEKFKFEEMPRELQKLVQRACFMSNSECTVARTVLML